ncbi:hypothetical protein, partial [Sphingobium sp. YR657]|uniref:hypothetical protein n=1 Tax=Sphingobium sp. YR657 TaxID=1884366 RepID=UPI0031379E58
TDNVKEPPTSFGGQPSNPFLASGGTVSVYVGDHPVQRRSGVVPSGEKPSRWVSLNRQTLFAFLFHIFLGVSG